MFQSEQWNIVSDAAKDFLCDLLRIKPHLCMPATQLLLHPWLRPLGQAGMFLEPLA